MQGRPIPVQANLQYKPYEPESAPHASASKLGIIVSLSIALVAGTGGMYEASSLSYASSILQSPIIEVRGIKPRREYLMGIAQQVTMLRDALGLKMSEVAQMFGVSRPSAYAWLNGSEPKPDIKIRIYKVRRLVEDLHGAGIKRIDLYARLPLASGESLLDSLMSGADLEGQVAAIKRTVLQPAPAVPADVQRGRANRKRVVGLDEISTSIFA